MNSELLNVAIEAVTAGVADLVEAAWGRWESKVPTGPGHPAGRDFVLNEKTCGDTSSDDIFKESQGEEGNTVNQSTKTKKMICMPVAACHPSADAYNGASVDPSYQSVLDKRALING